MNELPHLYPLRFRPTYHRKIWGGERICQFKNIPSPHHDIGETWEISSIPGSESVVLGGTLDGCTLSELIADYGADLVGHHVFERYGTDFPLLVKLIDTNETLSVQVHPDDGYAREHHGGMGKSEAWYLLSCMDDAKIYAGWRKQTNREDLPRICADGSVMEYLGVYEAKPRDLFYLPPGRIHTIGAGCLLLEIQQASDLTYRVYDFDRRDAEGNPRELHQEHAVAVIDFSITPNARLFYDQSIEHERVSLLRTSYYDIGMLQISGSFTWDLAQHDSFTILFVDEGEVLLECPNGVERLSRGDFLLLPAALEACYLLPISEQVRIIDCYVP